MVAITQVDQEAQWTLNEPLPEKCANVLRLALKSAKDIANNVPLETLEQTYRNLDVIYRKETEFKIATKLMAAACLYISCQQTRFPMTIKEICEKGNVKKNKMFTETIRKCKTVLGLKMSHSFTVRELIERYCADLNFHDSDKELAIDIADRYESNIKISRHLPASLAAAAISAASSINGEKLHPQIIEKVTSIKYSTFQPIESKMMANYERKAKKPIRLKKDKKLV